MHLLVLTKGSLFSGRFLHSGCWELKFFQPLVSSEICSSTRSLVVFLFLTDFLLPGLVVSLSTFPDWGSARDLWGPRGGFWSFLWRSSSAYDFISQNLSTSGSTEFHLYSLAQKECPLLKFLSVILSRQKSVLGMVNFFFSRSRALQCMWSQYPQTVIACNLSNYLLLWDGKSKHLFFTDRNKLLFNLFSSWCQNNKKKLFHIYSQ